MIEGSDSKTTSGNLLNWVYFFRLFYRSRLSPACRYSGVGRLSDRLSSHSTRLGPRLWIYLIRQNSRLIRLLGLDTRGWSYNQLPRSLHMIFSWGSKIIISQTIKRTQTATDMRLGGKARELDEEPRLVSHAIKSRMLDQ